MLFNSRKQERQFGNGRLFLFEHTEVPLLSDGNEQYIYMRDSGSGER